MDQYDYWLIEPNPHCTRVLRGLIAPGIELSERALWDKDTELQLYGHCERPNTDPGCSVEQRHNSLYYATDSGNAVKVPTIDCNRLITYAADKYQTIICKLDIESSEYPVLEALIKTGNIKFIDKLFIEFHTQYMCEADRNYFVPREERIKEQLNELKIDWTEWH